MKIFITGGTGFIGSHLINHAYAKGIEVVALRREGSLSRIELKKEPQWVTGDLESVQDYYLDGCQAMVHLAGVGVNPADANWEECFRWNVSASLALWRKAIDCGVKKFIIIGSCFEYGSSGEKYEYIPVNAPLMPVGAYSASKAAATMAAAGLAQATMQQFILLRPFHTFGEGEDSYRLWPSLRKAAQDGRDFEMTAGEQVRDFTPVGLVCEKIIECLSIDSPNVPFVIKNVGTGKPCSIFQFAQYWWNHWQAKGELKVAAIPYRDREIMRYVPEINW